MDPIRRFPWLGIATLLPALAGGCDPEDSDETGDSDEPAAWTCGEDLEDERDGAVYRTVVVGTQCWLGENMNLGTMIESTASGSLAHDDGVVEKYCWDDVAAECDGTGDMKRGGFYEWQEALQDWSGESTLPVQGICPAGFHLPSREEWDVLVDLFGGTSQAPARLAAGGDSGFEALMTGYRCTMSGGFRPSAMSAATMTYFWTTEGSASGVWLWEVGETSMQTFAFEASLGLSVRCVGDAVP